MHKVRVPGLLGLLLLWVMFLVAGAHLVLNDVLFFHSDAWSMVVYLGTASLAASPVLLAAVVVSRRLPAGMRAWLDGAAIVGFAVVVVAVALRLVLGLIVGAAALWWPMLVYFVVALLGAWPTLACFVVALLGVLFGVDRRRLAARAQTFGIPGLVLVLGLVPSMVGWNHLRAFLDRGSGKTSHLVLIVLDGFPSAFLRSYNAEAEATAFDEVLQEGRLFRGVRTSAPYTHMFFGHLYTGRLDPKTAADESALGRGGLLACLQRHGVRARWICYHRCGFPEGCEARITRYRGLRSLLLTEHYTWLPAALGLDYHVALNMPPRMLCWRDRARGWLLHRLNGGKSTKFDNVFLECLLPEMCRLRRLGGRTFLLFHVGWTMAARGDLPTARGAQEDLSTAQWDDDDTAEAVDTIRKDDYRYGPALEAYVRARRETTARQVAVVGPTVADFVAGLRREGLAADTTLIITADHGTIYDKGRCWYGFHPNQEVVKVLCAVLGPGQTPGLDDRLFCTPDLTASVMDYFGIQSGPGEEAVSILRDGPGRPYTASLTMNSDRWHEWWLVIVCGNVKYWFNLHPEGSGQAVAYQRDTFEQVQVPLDGPPGAAGPPREMMPIVRESLRRFGTSDAAIHPAYRGTPAGR